MSDKNCCKCKYYHYVNQECWFNPPALPFGHPIVGEEDWCSNFVPHVTSEPEKPKGKKLDAILWKVFNEHWYKGNSHYVLGEVSNKAKEVFMELVDSCKVDSHKYIYSYEESRFDDFILKSELKRKIKDL